MNSFVTRSVHNEIAKLKIYTEITALGWYNDFQENNTFGWGGVVIFCLVLVQMLTK